MNINKMINRIGCELKGHNALIQIQVDNQYFVKRIGDVNQLVDNPKIIADGWKDQKNCIKPLSKYQG